MPPTHYDHIIVGSGQATGTLLGGLPEDESFAVVEGSEVGGTCVNTGCTPTKTLVASARVAHMARRASDFGVDTTVEIDFPRVMERMNEIRHGSRDGFAEWLEETDRIDLIRGWARFVAPKTLQVGDERITGTNIYLNVGARARDLPIPGLDEIEAHGHADLLELDAVPEHLLVIGGGYVGLEFAQIFRRFGASVTVLDAADEIAQREDPDIAASLRAILEDEGIEFELSASIDRVERTDDGVAVLLEDGARRIDGSHLLVAAGRVPNSDRLDLPKAGIETDERGFIAVDDHLRTNVEGVYALGDVNGEGAFTHTSVNDAEIVLDVMGGGPRALSDRIPVYALFTDPPLGRVGLTETQALQRGYRIKRATLPMRKIARAREMGETKGMVKLIVDADTDLILGAAILGVSGDEVINMFAAFMYSGRPCSDYRRSVLVHPTVSELMPWILDELELVEPEAVTAA